MEDIKLVHTILEAVKVTMQEEFKPVNDRLDRLDGRLESIEQDVAVLKKDVHILKDDVTEIKTAVIRLEETQAEDVLATLKLLKLTVDEVHHDVTILNRDMVYCLEKGNRNERDISHIQQRINTLSHSAI